MQTLMLTVEYDGTRYAGWKAAPKKENLDTVLGRIHTALARLLKEDIQLFCAAKTDPGVHARGQILSFQTTSSLLPSALKSSLNQAVSYTHLHSRLQKLPYIKETPPGSFFVQRNAGLPQLQFHFYIGRCV